MKKETYTFIIGLGIGYGVKKFIDKPITATKADLIQGIKKKVSDEFFKLLWAQTPEEYYNRQRYSRPYTDYYTSHNHKSYRRDSEDWRKTTDDKVEYRGKYKVKNDPYEQILDNLAERLYSNGEITLEDVENVMEEVKGE